MTLHGMNVIDSFVLDVNTATSLSNAVPPLVNGYMSGRTVYRMIISVEDGAVRWRADGTDPTATVGHLIDDGGTLTLTGANYKSVIKSMKFIKVAGTALIFGTAFD
jgi:hypothetical protein